MTIAVIKTVSRLVCDGLRGCRFLYSSRLRDFFDPSNWTAFLSLPCVLLANKVIYKLLYQ